MSSARVLSERLRHAARWRSRACAAWTGRRAEILGSVARSHARRSPVGTARRVAAVLEQGFTLDEAFSLDLLDPVLAPADMRGQVSKRRLIELQERLNPRELWYLTEDKFVFYRYAERAGLPVPRLHAILCASGGGWTSSGDVLTERRDWIRYLESGAPTEFVVKPSRGYHGLGIRIIERRGRVLHVVGSEPLAAAELADQLAEDRQFHSYVVQERLYDHPGLPGDGRLLQTLRIVTFVDSGGGISVLNAQLRLGGPASVIDNFRNGMTGNMLVVVDPESGLCGDLIAADDQRVFRVHPPGSLPGAPARGVRLPVWGQILDAVRSAAREFLPMRAIGWDVAITARGPQIVEANIWWDPPTPQGDVAAIVDRMRLGLSAGARRQAAAVSRSCTPPAARHA